MVFKLESDYTCQVPGCNADLLAQKKYNQRCRICREHQTAVAVHIDGLFTRYCQQCAFMQPLHDFHGEQRSCISALDYRRKRLYLRSSVSLPAKIVLYSRPGYLEHLYSTIAVCSQNVQSEELRMSVWSSRSSIRVAVARCIGVVFRACHSSDLTVSRVHKVHAFWVFVFAACLKGHDHVDIPARQDTTMHSSDPGGAHSENECLWLHYRI